MRNLKLTLRYDGSAFHGWQFQPNCETVEQKLKEACRQILREDVSLQSCSRTDTGVHANMFCCNFKSSSQTEARKIIRGLNAVLPETIAVYDCEDVPENFHARFDCKGKEYIYKIWNGKQRNPFYNKYALHFQRPLDVDFLTEQAQALVGTHDFSAFCASGCTVKSHVRTITDCKLIRSDELVTFHIIGDGFLYNMVRIIVGTLLDLSDGKIEKDSIAQIIASKDREKAGITAKPDGLYLNKVFY